MRPLYRTTAIVLALAFATAAHAAPPAGNLRVEMGKPGASKNFAPDPEKQKELLAKIQSPSTPRAEKAMACKGLVVHGTEEAIPVLTPLLADPELASWARLALEAMPGSAADAALRNAMPKLNGNLLIGVINSIGERRDSRAVVPLTARLRDSDPEVVSAAAVALGKIGGNGAASSLGKALAQATPATASAIAEGCIRSAEQYLAAGKASQARKLYDAVRQAQVPRNKVLEATRGAILARGDQGIPMLLEQLSSSEQDEVAVGLRTARELPGRKTTEAVAVAVKNSSAERQAHVLLALADRNDPAALPTIIESARGGYKPARLVAVGVLERLGDLSSVPVLLQVATDKDADLSRAAVGSLVRLAAPGVDADLASRLGKASDREREVLIRVAGQRQISQALDPIMASMHNSDPAVRKAAMQALGSLATEKQVPQLVKFIESARDAKDRAQAEDTLLAISARCPAAVGTVAPLARSAEPEMRSLALRCLSAMGGSEALAAVRQAIGDKDPELQDEAVNVLVAWPNTWPEDSAVAAPLLDLARNGTKRSHQLLALRGYIQYVQGDSKLQPQDKVTKLRDVLPLVQRPEEKRLAIAALGDIWHPDAVDLLVTMVDDAAVLEDACSSLLKLGMRNVSGLPKPARQKALQTVIDKSANENARKRAEERLKGL